MTSPDPLPGADRAAIDPAAHRALAGAHRAAGRELEARAEECGATALEAGAPLALFDLAAAFGLARRNDDAERWYRVAMAADPDLAQAHQNLACLLEIRGEHAAAAAHRERAFRGRCVQLEPAGTERRRVLVLAASGLGNVPLQWLLPRAVNTRILWFAEFARPDDPALPAHDLVLNAIGDADLSGPTAATLRRFLRASRVPLLNRPTSVARTRRDRLPRWLGGIGGIETPPVLRARSRSQAVRRVADAALPFPLLLRPAGSHGGQGLRRLERPADLAAAELRAAPAWYLTPFRDYRSPDGLWRKYRVVFVDRRPYPCHLAISRHWLVHYASADMPADPHRRAEEQRFLECPQMMLGAAAWAALEALGARLDLDYAGVDFALFADGRLLVFEANATMLVHPERHPALGYRNHFVQRILAAFEAMLAHRQCPAR